jgi:hypothetical protein
MYFLHDEARRSVGLFTLLRPKNRRQGKLELIANGSTQRDERRLENWSGQILTWPSWWKAVDANGAQDLP